MGFLGLKIKLGQWTFEELGFNYQDFFKKN